MKDDRPDRDRDLDALLGALPALDVDASTAERIRVRARARLATAAGSPARRAVRVAELGLVGVLGAVYLLLAVQATLLPFQ